MESADVSQGRNRLPIGRSDLPLQAHAPAVAGIGARNVPLDVLRGIAILLVFGRHLELPRPDGGVGVAAKLWFQVGWLGVDLFFVLSGFLIGGLLLTELRKHGRLDIGRFLVRRGLKIYPAYFVFIAYLILVPTAKVLAQGGAWDATLLQQWKMYWPNLLFLQNYVGTNPAGHTWTLAVEEHFYLLLPFVLAALAATGRTRMLLPLCLVVVPALLLMLRIVSVGTGDAFAQKMSASHLRLDALLFGVGLRALALAHPDRFAAAREWRGTLLAVGLALWSVNLWVEPTTAFVRTVGLMTNFLGSAAFLLAALHMRAADLGAVRIVAAPLAGGIAWIGVYSYGIYLWHVTAMGILERVVGGRVSAWIAGHSAAAWLVTASAVCAGAVLAGVVLSKLVEWPVLHLRDRWFPSRAA